MKSITCGDPSVNRSPDLIAANQRLLARRAAVQQHKAVSNGQSNAHAFRPKPPRTPSPHLAPLVNLTPIETAALEQKTEQTLTIASNLLIAILKRGETGLGRIWLLARLLDEKGQGWVDVAALREQLTQKEAPLKVCGWRRLRQLLQAGQARYWQRDSRGRLWLAGQKTLARRFGLARLDGAAQVLSSAELVAPLPALRARFYTSVHTNRDGAPISRKTLQKITGIAPRSQQTYDRLASVKSKANYAVEGSDSAETVREHIWQNQHNSFTFTDRRGKLGSPGQRYRARRLPNSYTCEAPSTQRRKQKTGQIRPNDLDINEAQGNIQAGKARLYCTNGHMAAKQINQDSKTYLRTMSLRRSAVWVGYAI